MTEPTGVDITLGRYRLAYELASGGMATVYLACLEGAAGVDKVVAVKRIHPHLAKDEEYVQMFLDEARIASQIHHANVCSVTDFGEADGAYYIVMEYLTGVPLNQLISAVGKRRDEVPDRWVSIVSKLVRDAAEGLHAAHELTAPDGSLLGVVHRDVSPHNLFVGFDGQLRVIDFGVAKAAGKLHQTSTGQAKGKVAYMAPEQVQRGQVDRRSDVWALGVVLWESLCLRRLFRRPSPGETVYAVLQDAVADPRSYEPEIPKRIAEAVARALDRDPESRTQDARSLANALAESWTGTAGATVTASEVGDLLRELFPGEEEKQKQLVSLARQGTSRVAQAGLGGASPSFSSLSYAAVPTPPGDTTSTSAVVPFSSSKRRSIAAALIITCCVGGGVAAALLGGTEDELAAVATPATIDSVERAEPAEPAADPGAVELVEPVEPVEPELPPELSPETSEDPLVAPDEPVAPERRAAQMTSSMGRPSMASHMAPSEPPSEMAAEMATAMAEADPVTPSAMQADPGRLIVVVPGGWANVYSASGRFLGATPLNREMSPGHHRLQLRFGGQPPAVHVEVDVPEGGAARLSRRAP